MFRSLLTLFKGLIDLVAVMIFIYIYLFIYMVIILAVNRIKLTYILWRKRIPRNVRKELIELYEEKIYELTRSFNISSLLGKTIYYNGLWRKPREHRVKTYYSRI